MNIKNVLITGGRSPVALHLARMCQRAGINVFVAESEPFHLCKHSKAVTRSIVVPKPNEDYDGFIAAILAFCQSQAIRFIIPTCEEIFHVAKAKDRLEQRGIKVFSSALETLHTLHHKFLFNELLQQLQLPAIETVQFTKFEQLQQFARNTSHRYVLKGSYSRFASNVYFLYEQSPLPVISISEKQPWVMQQFIEGRQFCSYSVAVEGRLVAHSCYPTTYTAGVGANVYYEHVEIREIETIVQTIVEKLDFTGQISFDFIQHRDGNFYAIECNPRATSGLHLFDDVRAFPFCFSEPQAATLYPTQKHTYRLGFPMLLYGVMNGYLFKQTKSFLAHFFQSKDVVFSKKDPLPYIYQLIYMTALLKRKWTTNKSLTELTTIDIEWSGE